MWYRVYKPRYHFRSATEKAKLHNKWKYKSKIIEQTFEDGANPMNLQLLLNNYTSVKKIVIL